MLQIMLLSYNWLLHIPCKDGDAGSSPVSSTNLRSSERPLESTEDRNKFHGVELAAQLQTSFKTRLVYMVKPHPYKLVKKVQVLQRVPSSSIPIGRGCKLKPCISDGSNPSWNTKLGDSYEALW